MLILSQNHDTHARIGFKLGSKDILAVTTDTTKMWSVDVRRGGSYVFSIGEYKTEAQANAVLTALLVFSAKLMTTPGMDPLFTRPLDKQVASV